MKSNTYYRCDFDFDGNPRRGFRVFGFCIAEEVGVQKIDDKHMVLHSGKEMMGVDLNNFKDLTVDRFIDEFHRLSNLPNLGKKLRAQ